MNLNIIKQKTLRTLSDIIPDLCIFSIFLLCIFSLYRFQIWNMSREFFSDLNPSLKDFLFLSLRDDSRIVLFSIGILFIITAVLRKRKILKYVITSLFCMAETLALLTGLVIFRLYETTMQKALLTDEIAAEWKQLLVSMISEIPDKFWFISAAELICLLIFSVMQYRTDRITPENYKRQLFVPELLHFFPALRKRENRVRSSAVFICLSAAVLCWFSLFAGGEKYLQKAAAGTDSGSIKKAAAGYRDITMNPVYNIVFEKSLNRQFSTQELVQDEDFRFGLNTDSLAVPGRKKKIEVLPSGKKYNIILYLFESTRASLTGFKTEKGPVTPVWQRLMKNGIYAENHYANYPLSANVLLSITGSCYEFPGRELIVQKYPQAPVKTVPEILKAAGYRNMIIHTGNLKYANQHLFIKGRGFDRIEDIRTLKDRTQYTEDVGWGLDERSMIEPVISFIKQDREKPFFILMMPVNPHHPYAVPDRPEDRGMFDIAGPISPELPIRERNRLHYLNSLHYADYCLGKFVDELEASGLMKNTILIAVADHGEAFYEHNGNYNHPFFLYEENVHVPLVIYSRELIKEPVRIKSVTSHVDILPTIQGLLGLKSLPEQEGLSMLEACREQMALFHTNWKYDISGIRDGRWKYMIRKSDSYEELYDLESDPLEQNNIADKNPETAAAYRAVTVRAGNYTSSYWKKMLSGLSASKITGVFEQEEMSYEEYQKIKKKKQNGKSDTSSH